MTEKCNTTYLKQFTEKVKKLLFSKDALLFLFFFFCAGGFWFVQSLDKQRDTTLKIPIDYMGIPEDIEIENKLPKQIHIKIRDQGMALMQYNRRNTVPLALDMARVYFGKGEFVITADQLKNRLSRYVLPTTAVLDIVPDSISVKYHKLSSKTLPIRVKSDLSFSSQYILSREIEVNPTRVKVFGPENVLDTMKAVYTEEVHLRSISDTTEIQVKLEQTKTDVRYAFDDVQVKVYVEMFTEKKIELPVNIINAPKNVLIRIFPPKVQVSYNVGLSNFNKIKESDIQLVFDYNEAQKSRRRRHKLHIVNHSPFVSKVRVWPDEVEYLQEEK